MSYHDMKGLCGRPVRRHLLRGYLLAGAAFGL